VSLHVVSFDDIPPLSAVRVRVLTASGAAALKANPKISLPATLK
jgi:hypothetical protein